MYRRRYPSNWAINRYPTRFGTRYRSTRSVTGLYRQPSRYVLTGRARRLFGGGRLAVQRIVRAMAEKKYYDTIATYGPLIANQISLTGTFLNLTDITQGPSNTERIGDKVTGSSLQFNMDVSYPGLGTSSGYNVTRLIIFLWFDDSNPTTAQIIEDITSPSVSPLAFDYKVKRKIIHDKVYTQAAAAGFQLNMRFNMKAVFNLTKMKGGKNIVNFSAAAAVNNIYMLLINTNGGAANTQWEYNVYTRYTFMDM